MHINIISDKNYIIISINAENDQDKIQHPFMIKALKKPRIEYFFLLFNIIFGKPTDNIILNEVKLNPFTLKSRMRQRCPLSTLTQYRS
jgi:hypothetical protein